jgi:error-prone DNA polymerase
VLGKTLGVPLFQEQAMQIAIVAAGFSPDEADKLRRAMATFRHVGTIHTFREKFIAGMARNGYAREFAERCFSQIEGFGEYGFPESHAASFALLVYVSSWIKCYYPEAFCAALLNSQPMGFYQPAQLVRDAREHGVEVRHPDINSSDWDCTLESAAASPLPPGRGREAMTYGRVPHPFRQLALGTAVSHSAELVRGESDRHEGPLIRPSGTFSPGGEGSTPILGEQEGSESRCAVRLGLRLIGGAPEEITKAIVAARGAGYPDVFSVWVRSGAPVGVLERLANADAFRSIGLDRRAALWAVKGLAGGALQAGPKRATSALAPILTQGETGDLFEEAHVALPATTLGEHVVEDYAAIGLSLKAHPVAFFREDLRRRGVLTSAAHWQDKLAGRRVSVAGLVLVRQRPGTAKGVIFLTLEDETGIVNVVVWPKVFEKNRRIVMTAQFLEVRGKIEREGLVIHVVADELIDRTHELKRLGEGTAGMPKTDKEIREGSWKPKSRDFH